MTEAEAREILEDMVASTVFPQLSADQITRLIRRSRRLDASLRLPDDDTEWAATTVYSVDDVVVPTVRNGRAYKVTVGGTSGATEPAWPVTDGGTVTLDGVTYEEGNGTLSVWAGDWDLNRAARDGWRIKAGMVTNRHAFGSNAGNYNPEQIFAHCNQMAEYYSSKTIATLAMAGGRWDGTGRLPAAHFDDAE